jgi:hypothetical protein
MARTSEKGALHAMSAQIDFGHLEQIRELNRAFLGLLQSRARMRRDLFGLPASIGNLLGDAESVALDDLARFPRALFRIDCDAAGCADAQAPASGELDLRQYHLTLQILWAARHTSRQSPHQARLLFTLDAGQVERIGSLVLPELERLAGRSGVLCCAFRVRSWLWPRLLTDVRPESRRQLALIALQPGLTNDWPRRRPPRSAL